MHDVLYLQPYRRRHGEIRKSLQFSKTLETFIACIFPQNVLNLAQLKCRYRQGLGLSCMDTEHASERTRAAIKYLELPYSVRISDNAFSENQLQRFFDVTIVKFNAIMAKVTIAAVQRDHCILTAPLGCGQNLSRLDTCNVSGRTNVPSLLPRPGSSSRNPPLQTVFAVHCSGLLYENTLGKTFLVIFQDFPA